MKAPQTLPLLILSDLERWELLEPAAKLQNLARKESQILLPQKAVREPASLKLLTKRQKKLLSNAKESKKNMFGFWERL